MMPQRKTATMDAKTQEKRDADGFTPKERAFVAAYNGPARMNASEAARLAGYSDNICGQTGWRMLAKPHIQRAIEDAMAKRLEDYDDLAKRIIAEHSKIAFADIRQVMDWGTKTALEAYGMTLEDFAKLKRKKKRTIMEDRIVKEVEDGTEREVSRLFSTGQLPPHITATIGEVHMTKDGLRLKMWDKQKSLDSLARFLGMNNDTMKTVPESHESLLDRLAREDREKEGKKN
jgi:phage terminase small subunit